MATFRPPIHAVKDLISAALGGFSYGTALSTAAAAAIITVGVFAALDQFRIAPAIVTDLFQSAAPRVAQRADELKQTVRSSQPTQ